jgi:hypothetical protein
MPIVPLRVLGLGGFRSSLHSAPNGSQPHHALTRLSTSQQLESETRNTYGPGSILGRCLAVTRPANASSILQNRHGISSLLGYVFVDSRPATLAGQNGGDRRRRQWRTSHCLKSRVDMYDDIGSGVSSITKCYRTRIW